VAEGATAIRVARIVNPSPPRWCRGASASVPGNGDPSQARSP
jgi:hypothetical protein